MFEKLAGASGQEPPVLQECDGDGEDASGPETHLFQEGDGDDEESLDRNGGDEDSSCECMQISSSDDEAPEQQSHGDWAASSLRHLPSCGRCFPAIAGNGLIIFHL